MARSQPPPAAFSRGSGCGGRAEPRTQRVPVQRVVRHAEVLQRHERGQRADAVVAQHVVRQVQLREARQVRPERRATAFTPLPRRSSDASAPGRAASRRGRDTRARRPGPASLCPLARRAGRSGRFGRGRPPPRPEPGLRPMRFFVVVVFVSELDVKLGALFGIRENDHSATGKQSDGALENRPPIDVATRWRDGARCWFSLPHARRSTSCVCASRGTTNRGSVRSGKPAGATRERRACFTESRRPQSRRAQSAPRSGRVAGRRAGSVTVRLVRASAADADATELATELAGERSAPRPLEPLVYHFEGDSATIVSARTGQLRRRGFRVTDATASAAP